MEWTEDKVLNLIKLYKNHPMLWDPKDRHYYKTNLKGDAWENIGQAMGMRGENCKNKMITLLSCYRREKMKMKNSRGKGTSKVYCSKWFAFDAMSFLLNRNAPGKNRSNIVNNIMETDEEKGGEEADVKSEQVNDTSKINYVSTNTIAPNDEIKHFLDFVRSKMLKYPEHTKNMVQRGICDLIFKADSQCFANSFYDRSVRYHTTPSTSRSIGSQEPSFVNQLSPSSSSKRQPSLRQLSPSELSPEQSTIASPSPHSDNSELLDMNDYVSTSLS